ncbi:MAG: ROK family transcriptional regulator [Desulfobacterales bacterium]|nr:ROK family transcriptional regulator [Desulfobacterales bacterium]
MPMPVRNLMRAMNRAAILDAIRTAGMISRGDLAQATGFSRASVTGLTADLIKEKLIIEKKAGDYQGGRRPMLLSLNPDGAYVVGVNMTIAEISVVIINFEARVLASHDLPLDSGARTVEEIADHIVRAVQACMWEASFSKDQISGVGLGIPGLVNTGGGVIRFLPNLGWENVNLRDLVREKLQHPVFIDNSSNTLAIAEQWFGQGRGVDNFLVITIENGVGLGCVINGRPYRGWEGVAGEFGHLTIDASGPPCRCGKTGCVEAYAGNISILRDARKSAREGGWRPADPDNVTYDDVLEAARGGVGELQEIFALAGRMLGVGVSHLITLYNPEKIIITGKGVRAREMLFDPMNESLRDLFPARFGRPSTEIVIQPWNKADWARGAGSLVLQELYKSPVIP